MMPTHVAALLLIVLCLVHASRECVNIASGLLVANLDTSKSAPYARVKSINVDEGIVLELVLVLTQVLTRALPHSPLLTLSFGKDNQEGKQRLVSRGLEQA